MTYEQLYIDGVLMDTDNKTQILLELKSNLLTDITKLAANKTYTIHLPKTVHNLTVLNHADRVSENSTWPYQFHTARYFRNGVELIKDGRAALLSATDDLEIVIVWGLSSPFAKLKEDDKKLNDLQSADVIKWDVSNPLDTPTSFFNRGYGYCGYSPWLNESEDEGWQGVDVTKNQNSVKTFHATSGCIKTGAMVGDVVLPTVEPRANWGYISIPFWIGCSFAMNRVCGGVDDYRLWSILDANDRVIMIAPPSDGTMQSMSITAPVNAATLLVNIDLSLSEHDYLDLYSIISQPAIIQFVGTGKAAKLIHPSVSVRWILDLIASETGIDCLWSGDALAFIESLAIPLVSKKANYLTQSLTAEVGINPSSALGALSMIVDGANSIVNEASGVVVSKLTVARDCGVQMDVQCFWSWDASQAQSNSSTTTGYDGVSQTSYQYIYFANYVEMTIKHADNSDDDTYIIGRESAAISHIIDQEQNKLNDRFSHIIAGYGHIDLKQGDEITFELKNAKGTLRDMRFENGQINIVMDGSDDVLRGNDFPIAYNLPEIKLTDFIKFLAAITGTFPLQSSSDDVVFVPISDVWANGDNAEDWTRKVIPAYGQDKPKQLDFKLSEWAQKNWYRWLADDKTIGNYDGEIVIDDNTLELTRDVFTFPFAASDGSSIPTYTRVKPNGTFGGANIVDNVTYDEPQYEECKPRIMVVSEDGNGHAVLNFSGLEMQTIITEKYSELVESLQTAKVIKENVRLSNVEILNFDETIPVYLQQHGSYFAVLEIKAAENGTAETTMFKINPKLTPTPPPPPIPDYLCFTALEAGTFTLAIPAVVVAGNLAYIEWGKDGRTWNRTVNDSSAHQIDVSVEQGDKVYWRGSGVCMTALNADSAKSCTFSSTARFDVSGHIMSLLKADNFDNYNHLVNYTTDGIRNYTFCNLFRGCTTLVNAKDLILPTFTSYYTYIFYYMFYGCTSLVSSPALTSLELSTACYFGLYRGCSNLAQPQVLLAPNLVGYCYRNMFQATKTNNVKCLATSISATDCVTNWLSNVPATGTFIQASNVTWPRSASGIPSNWTIEEE